MTSTVLPFMALSMASCTRCSLSASSAEVASSRRENIWVEEEGSGNGDALLLSAGETNPSLPDHRVVAMLGRMSEKQWRERDKVEKR